VQCDEIFKRPFFADPPDPRTEVRELAVEAIRRLLIWIAEGATLEERGLRTSVALYCIRPDLIDGATLVQIGELSGRSREAVHKLHTSPGEIPSSAAIDATARE
jgi:hypothetical protein